VARLRGNCNSNGNGNCKGVEEAVNMHWILKAIATYTQPHLSGLLGSKVAPAIDWKTIDKSLIPLNRCAAAALDASRKNGVSSALPASFDMRRPYRILCLDGGGVRGVLTVALLARIVEHKPDFMSKVDFICGTSAGGILSLLLAAGYSPKECLDIYGFAAPHIFGYNPWRVINPTRAKYSDKAKQELMMHYFGETKKMKDLAMTCAVVSFRLDGRRSSTHSFFSKEGWRPAVFSNMPKHAGRVDPDDDMLVYDAAMCTSAAPTFFPVYKSYTDGGIVANNPSILACAKAMAHYPSVSSNNVVVLSLGAGSYPRHINFVNTASKQFGTDLNKADWGIRQWIPFLMDIL
jgi:uncharacterized protein